MTLAQKVAAPIRHADRFYIDGAWIRPSSQAVIDVIDSGTEELFFQVPEALDADMIRAIEAARTAFDEGPWPRLTHAERSDYLRAFASALRERGTDVALLWPRESGVLHALSKYAAPAIAGTFEYYADVSETYPFEESVPPLGGSGLGLVVREPVGVVAAIVPWNGPLDLIASKLAPALLAGCTVIIKSAPEAPGEGYVVAEIAEAIGLPPGVVNVLTAGRKVSEILVRDPRVDKIAFTGSTAAGRRIASLCGQRIARYTLELGGKSAAIILDDYDLTTAAQLLADAECMMTGQVCSSLTRIVVSKNRHDEFVEALSATFSRVRVGDPFDSESQMGPLALMRQRDRVEAYIAKGIADGATLAAGGGRPAHLDRGWYIEPTVFGNVDNSSTIAQEEIFGPVLSVIPAENEHDAIAIANDTIYGLNASVFTNDVDLARQVARQLRSGTVVHNAVRAELGKAPFGGFKQSGVGREGGLDGLLPYLEAKTLTLQTPATAVPRIEG